MQEARELELLVGAGVAGEVAALEGMLELGDRFAAVPMRRRARHRVEKAIGHRGHARANFWSDRSSRGGFMSLPCAVHETSAT